jgi:feruloyl esterase
MFRMRRKTIAAGSCTLGLVLAWAAGSAQPSASARMAGPPLSAYNFRDLPVDSPLTRIGQRAQTGCEAIQPLRKGVVQTAELVPAEGATPEHCLVAGTLPTDIGFAVRLPLAWNGRLYMSGNGGFAGHDPVTMFPVGTNGALARGFMTVREDTGHKDNYTDSAWFYEDRTKVINHAYLAQHEAVTYAKELARAFYGARPKFSYWDGCSTGGREGVMAATRYPEDFDGIFAGAPTLVWSAIMLKGAWNERQLNGSGLTAAKFATVFKSVMNQCDGLDGVKDGLISDPRVCHVDIGEIPSCASGEDAGSCLTPMQKDRLVKLYAGPPKEAGVPKWLWLYPGFESPESATPFVLGPGGQPGALGGMADTWMRHVAFPGESFDWRRSFDFRHAPPRLRRFDDLLDPAPNLDAFARRGGKMITWWGLADTALNPQMGIDYYDQVAARMGMKRLQSFYRLYLIPGVGHCWGGYGPSAIDPMSPLIKWVERGEAPGRLPARSADGKYNRAYCAYPARTVYKGSGDPENPANYECRTGQQGSGEP